MPRPANALERTGRRNYRYYLSVYLRVNTPINFLRVATAMAPDIPSLVRYSLEVKRLYKPARCAESKSLTTVLFALVLHRCYARTREPKKALRPRRAAKSHYRSNGSGSAMKACSQRCEKNATTRLNTTDCTKRVMCEIRASNRRSAIAMR